ncbi:bifunctional phosphoribosylaminoimidazolecarboxamide formyltransferase/IMP cyclohydrolase [Candidatus Epulonipiscium fishelsonii]|uniref:Bifunctional phosphoribosylaminoimidazolecarboxamide formyltransferase/IMP cyclohydrolase n=1 Tax=Candidatus Epulonipiscium fishelsonii TaxID=77094 RepID=A0ACC8X8W6_9FIRM|nr:bifunctional phosphoribosylaminoimidazolecarboxamide formyltransferase/IMP cyclohydrolase [Epulopiscium sp. SCG-B11WGA-EpuloA1]ONI42128.1 bifunctional phosphoribosylaminoimidazolecarboxamide formyltransferase/IMP cyclohydrolase [Epulopiscium sp. SCG-B05WGA-EpuloA1]
MKKRALISVSDKTGVVEFARDLKDLGFEIISTGGTSKVLAENGIDVIGISEITSFPECLDGRVKTLHPNIYAGILAVRDNKEHMAQIESLNVETIDVVAINLYPFKETILKENVSFEEAIENIDIGGPSMIRASAKNWQDVAVIVDPTDYIKVIEELKAGSIKRETKLDLAIKVFEYTSAYDTLICNYLQKFRGNENAFPEKFTVTYEKVQDLRYGENGHQQASFYKEVGHFKNTLAYAKQLNGKELSFNNINDANATLDIIKEFGYDKPVAVAVKHANPCGVGIGETLIEAYTKCYEADPISIFGGIVALNREVDEQTALELSKIFLEIIIAPSFSKEAMDILTKKPNLRLLELKDLATPNANILDFKKVAGGLLVQNLDTQLYAEEDLEVVTKRKPTEEEMEQLIFAWKVVKHVKSNGIALVKNNATTGIGPGQTNRITALELAVHYAKDNAKGSVMGSDAFFPFDDCVRFAGKAGITAIIQPGGSIRDEDSIKACDELGIAMVFTKIRHFKH